MLIVAEFEPTELVASIVTLLPFVTESGIPEITPVLALKASPLGSEPLVIDHELAAPPVFVGTKSVIAVSLVKRYGEPE